jgi:hypothetical protein
MKPGIEVGKALWHPQLGAFLHGAELEAETFFRKECDNILQINLNTI